MIAMFLSPGSVESDKKLYEGQGTVQAILLLAAVFSVPVMLFAKPCIKKSKYKKVTRQYHQHVHLHAQSFSFMLLAESFSCISLSFSNYLSIHHVNMNDITICHDIVLLLLRCI